MKLNQMNIGEDWTPERCNRVGGVWVSSISNTVSTPTSIQGQETFWICRGIPGKFTCTEISK